MPRVRGPGPSLAAVLMVASDVDGCMRVQMADSNDKLTVEKEALEDSLRKATETADALEASVKTLTARNDQLGREKELATASVRDMLQVRAPGRSKCAGTCGLAGLSAVD